jgi:hypothetical protein
MLRKHQLHFSALELNATVLPQIRFGEAPGRGHRPKSPTGASEAMDRLRSQDTAGANVEDEEQEQEGNGIFKTR